MQAAVGETTYPVMGGIKWHKSYHAQRATPLAVRDIVNAHLMFVTLHHILTDGWSEDVMWRELWATYDACVAGQRVELPPLPIQYADVAVWQRGWLAGADIDAKRRLIEQENLRLGGEPSRQQDFLLIAAAEGIDRSFKSRRSDVQPFDQSDVSGVLLQRIDKQTSADLVEIGGADIR